MYGTTYSGRRETSFSEGEDRTARFVIENMLFAVLYKLVYKTSAMTKSLLLSLLTNPEQAGSV